MQWKHLFSETKRLLALGLSILLIIESTLPIQGLAKLKSIPRTSPVLAQALVEEAQRQEIFDLFVSEYNKARLSKPQFQEFLGALPADDSRFLLSQVKDCGVLCLPKLVKVSSRSYKILDRDQPLHFEVLDHVEGALKINNKEFKFIRGERVQATLLRLQKLLPGQASVGGLLFSLIVPDAHAIFGLFAGITVAIFGGLWANDYFGTRKNYSIALKKCKGTEDEETKALTQEKYESLVDSAEKECPGWFHPIKGLAGVCKAAKGLLECDEEKSEAAEEEKVKEQATDGKACDDVQFPVEFSGQGAAKFSYMILADGIEILADGKKYKVNYDLDKGRWNKKGLDQTDIEVIETNNAVIEDLQIGGKTIHVALSKYTSGGEVKISFDDFEINSLVNRGTAYNNRIQSEVTVRKKDGERRTVIVARKSGAAADSPQIHSASTSQIELPSGNLAKVGSSECKTVEGGTIGWGPHPTVTSPKGDNPRPGAVLAR